MPAVIALRFPWGRFHGTPWNTGANEGNPEWPPSPWRILRALLATFKWRSFPNLEQEVVDDVLQGLASAPSYHLPRQTAVGHTRHYLPGVDETTSKVFDPFVVVDRQAELFVRWDVDLTGPQREALAQLCEQLPYLGRAEAICEARLLSEGDPLPTDGWIPPGTVGSLHAPARRTLAPIEPLDLAALALRTTDVRRAGRITPPGTRWVSYDVNPDRAPPTLPARTVRRGPARIEAVSLAIDAAVRPSVRDTVWVAHVARQAALDRRGTHCEVLAGKDENERTLTGHRHAHYLPLDLDGDKLLDAVLVWAPAGFGSEEIGALGRISRLYAGMPGFRPVRVALQGAAPLKELCPGLVARGGEREWVSVTPFAPYRHQKRETAEAFYAAEVARELATRGFPPATVEMLTGRSWLDWRRARPGRPEVRAVGLRLRFADPIKGPISLGNLSHFGLGLFKPAER